MRPLLVVATMLIAGSALAQHDISQVEPVGPDAAMATPIPEKRRYKKYDIPDLAGARQAVGSQLIEGRLRKPVVDFLTSDGQVEQRVSIFEGGLVVVNMTGATTIRKKLLIPDDAMRSYVRALSVDSLEAIDRYSLPAPEPMRRSLLRVYDASGRFVERTFHPARVLPKSLTDQITPLRDLLRAISEDREVTSSVAGYEPQAGDELVADDQKTYRVTRVVEGSNVVELKCLDSPNTIYVAKKDLYLYFLGKRAP